MSTSSIGNMLMNRDQQYGKRTNWCSEYLQLQRVAKNL